jgi:hypothetical protein
VIKHYNKICGTKVELSMWTGLILFKVFVTEGIW